MRKLIRLTLSLSLVGILIGGVAVASVPQGASYITPAEALSLPKTGNGFTNASWAASYLKTYPAPNLGDVNTRAGSEALTAAVFWLAGGKSDAALLSATRAFILKAPGTWPSGGQALNPMRGLGGILAAVKLLTDAGQWSSGAKLPNLGNITWATFISNLETRNLGTLNSRWQTILGTAIDTASNWGSVARFSLVSIAALRGDQALFDRAVGLVQRYMGDLTKAAAFNRTASYRASWDNYGSPAGRVNAGIGKLDGSGRDGVVIEDVARGGTDYCATCPYFGATGSGLTYPLEAAEYTWATLAVLRHAGFDVRSWTSTALKRMNDWFQRAHSGSTTVYLYAESAFSIYKNDRWYANRLTGGTSPYGAPVPTASGPGGYLRSQPPGDWMAAPGSTWMSG